MVKAVAVGNAIKELRQAKLRKDADFTQEHVSHEADVSLRHYQKIEAGMVDMKMSTLFAIADVLGTTPQKILDYADEMRPRGRATRKK